MDLVRELVAKTCMGIDELRVNGFLDHNTDDEPYKVTVKGHKLLGHLRKLGDLPLPVEEYALKTEALECIGLEPEDLEVGLWVVWRAILAKQSKPKLLDKSQQLPDLPKPRKSRKKKD